MISIPELVETDHQFYPTPPELADKMLEGVELWEIHCVLEPSAGKGDLIKALRRFYEKCDQKRHYNRPLVDVDCCEIDPHLRHILRGEFSGDPEREPPLVVRIVHDDFMTFRSRKNYDLILMNPPFTDGDRHLLRAIEIQKDGGAIICLLNAETIRNPYTATRKTLVEKLGELGATVEYVKNAFAGAERRADVDVAIVRVYIEPCDEGESEIWETMRKAAAVDAIPDAEVNALVAGDYIEQALQLYQTEISATLELVRQYKLLTPHIRRTLDPNNRYEQDPILQLGIRHHDRFSPDAAFDVNEYLRTVRLKYWNALFQNKKFTARLTSALRDKYQKNINRMADYDFSAFNIKEIMAEMGASIVQGVKDAIMTLFEKLTVEHSWYPECKKNIHYFNGWKTNKAHKIGKKCIIPTYGMFANAEWTKQAFNTQNAYDVISDIEKAFSYLDGEGAPQDSDLSTILENANANGQTRNIRCKYFSIDLFKKGTTHIKFHPEAMRLVDRLNVYAARERKWLPPDYGQKAYSNMDTEEKAVIDSFHGDGGEGTGAKGYAEVMQNAAFYLANPGRTMEMLPE